MSTRKSMVLIVVAACVFGFLAMLRRLPHPSEAARRSQCVNNLKQISLALHMYHNAYGKFPPAYVADAQGKPLHSWRVLILPFMEQQALYERYNFQEPWDGPGNIKLAAENLLFFRCPSHYPGSPSDRGKTCYLAMTGPGTIFPGADSSSFGPAADQVSHTLMVMESARDSVPWTSPQDLDVTKMSFRVNGREEPGLTSRHPGGVNVGLGDGSVRWLPDSTPPEQLKALTQIGNREKPAEWPWP